MPHEQMDENQVAAYLHLDVRRVVRLACRGKVPCRKVGGHYLFRKGQVDQWVEEQMHELDAERLAGIEKGVSDHHGIDAEELEVCSLIPTRGVAVPLAAKTSEAALRALVDLAAETELVHEPKALLEHLRRREELCSTALLPGVAMPHPRYPLTREIASSFVVVGLTPSGVPFAAPDGSLTRLFFLICAKDERTHLHVLARLARMLHDQGSVDSLLSADDAEELRRLLVQREESVAGDE